MMTELDAFLLTREIGGAHNGEMMDRGALNDLFTARDYALEVGRSYLKLDKYGAPATYGPIPVEAGQAFHFSMVLHELAVNNLYRAVENLKAAAMCDKQKRMEQMQRVMKSRRFYNGPKKMRRR